MYCFQWLRYFIDGRRFKDFNYPGILKLLEDFMGDEDLKLSNPLLSHKFLHLNQISQDFIYEYVSGFGKKKFVDVADMLRDAGTDYDDLCQFTDEDLALLGLKGFTKSTFKRNIEKLRKRNAQIKRDYCVSVTGFSLCE